MSLDLWVSKAHRETVRREPRNSTERSTIISPEWYYIVGMRLTKTLRKLHIMARSVFSKIRYRLFRTRGLPPASNFPGRHHLTRGARYEIVGASANRVLTAYIADGTGQPTKHPFTCRQRTSERRRWAMMIYTEMSTSPLRFLRMYFFSGRDVSGCVMKSRYRHLVEAFRGQVGVR